MADLIDSEEEMPVVNAEDEPEENVDYSGEGSGSDGEEATSRKRKKSGEKKSKKNKKERFAIHFLSVQNL